MFKRFKINRLRKRWVKALRSGKFAQTTSVLKRKLVGVGPGDHWGYCCLGVACELLPGEWTDRGEFTVRDRPSEPYFNGKNTIPQDEDLARFGMTHDEANVLAQANDRGESFDSIADRIEEMPVHYDL